MFFAPSNIYGPPIALLNSFDAEIPVPNVQSHHELVYILEEVKLFPEANGQIRVLDDLSQVTSTRAVNVDIKKILMGVENARQDGDTKGRFFRECDGEGGQRGGFGTAG
ncbi:hypothetical protein BGX38DRAFT_1269323 [Terfezia claveryi]|nr:hypothetical protein BGX38DRAFT_1269323 [Terfezia claveryi]